MAEAIARFQVEAGKIGQDHGKIFVISAGTSASDGALVSNEAIQTLKRMGIAHDGRSKRLTSQMVRAADIVFGMTASHVKQARDLVAGEKQQVAKIHALDECGDVWDPIGLGDVAYDRIAAEFMELIPRRLSEVLAR